MTSTQPKDIRIMHEPLLNAYIISYQNKSFYNTLDIPNVSTTGSFLTMAFLLAILITPRASVTVTTIGRPSGMAATARLDNK